MKRIRVIPILLIKEGSLVKSKQFRNYRYIGDPINAVKIFNEKEVDELAIIDITAGTLNRMPDMTLIRQLTSEAFMPMTYGGGITDINQVQQILFSGIEKVMLNSAAYYNNPLITQIAEKFGRQSVVISIDVKKNIWGKNKVFVKNGSVSTNLDPVNYAVQCEACGAGEILITSVTKEGTYNGYDLELIESVSSAVSIPVVACGGASSLLDFKNAALQSGASAVAAGSMFVFQRPHEAVLISYPPQKALAEELYRYL